MERLFWSPKKINQKGFTLVELAIVLMIIGLLIGGILRGQELMNNSRVTTFTQQIKSYEGAAITFRDIYGQVPGDLANAANKLSGCTTDNNCVAGNNDGIVGIAASRMWGGANNTDILTENFQFWKHLALAN